MKKIDKSILKEVSKKNRTPVKILAYLSENYKPADVEVALRELVRSGKVHVDMNWKLSLDKTK